MWSFNSTPLRLSTWALNRIHWIRIPDPDSMQSRVVCTLHANYAHCTAGLDLTHCPRALLRSTARSLDPDQDHVEAKWSSEPDPWSASDPDPRSGVESPFVAVTWLPSYIFIVYRGSYATSIYHKFDHLILWRAQKTKWMGTSTSI